MQEMKNLKKSLQLVVLQLQVPHCPAAFQKVSMLEPGEEEVLALWGGGEEGRGHTTPMRGPEELITGCWGQGTARCFLPCSLLGR